MENVKRDGSDNNVITTIANTIIMLMLMLITVAVMKSPLDGAFAETVYATKRNKKLQQNISNTVARS